LPWSVGGRKLVRVSAPLQKSPVHSFSRKRVEKMLDGDLEEFALILFGAFLLCFFYNFLSTFLKNLRETQSKVLRHDDDGEEEEHKTLLKPLDVKV
jgi:hypothetical protein